MKIMFLGVGEACDERLPNTSIWLRTVDRDGQRRSILLDCGPTVTPLYFSQTRDPEELDALWVSHFHGDHFLGIPTLLLRLWETKRQKPLTIIGQAGIKQLVERTMELAYPSFLHKLTYALAFNEVEPHQEASDILGLSWRFAVNGHGMNDLAVRIEDGRHCIFYSGDGSPTPQTLAIAERCSLLVHEAFDLDENTPGHGTVAKCIEFARQAGAERLALVHIQRDVRKNRYHEILDAIHAVKEFPILLPQPGHVVEL